MFLIIILIIDKGGNKKCAFISLGQLRVWDWLKTFGAAPWVLILKVTYTVALSVLDFGRVFKFELGMDVWLEISTTTSYHS